MEFAELRKETISYVMCAVRLSVGNNSAPTGRSFMNLSKNLSLKLKFHHYLTRINSNFHEDQQELTIISHRIILRMGMLQIKVLEKIKSFYIQ